MPKITKIAPQKKDSQKFNVYLDNTFAFGLDAETLVKYHLHEGDELTSKEINEIIAKSEFGKLYHKALKFLSYRPRSEKEVKEYLNKKLKLQKTREYNKNYFNPENKEQLINKVIKKLIQIGQIDDQKFAKWWIEQRLNFRPKGKRWLQMELKSKGVNEESIGDIPEEELARKAVAKKRRSFKSLSISEFRQKMFAYLWRLGFSSQTIHQILAEENRNSLPPL